MKFIIIILCGMLTMTSCYEKEYWVDDNTTSEGKHFPVIAKLAVDSDGPYVVGDQLSVDLFYWSVDEIQKVDFYTALQITDTFVSGVMDIDADTVFTMDVISDTMVINGTTVVIVDTVITNLNITPAHQIDVWMDSIRIISPKTLIETKPYASNFDELQQTDKMSFSYPIEAGLERARIDFSVTVTNTNGLTRDKSIGIDIEK